MSEIKHNMPDVIYAGLLASTFVNYGEWTKSRSALNETSYTRTDIYEATKAELERVNKIFDEVLVVAKAREKYIQENLIKRKKGASK